MPSGAKSTVRIGSGVGSHGMGDILLLTAICKYLPECVVTLHPKGKKYARFFDGICAGVEITENPCVTPDVGIGHFAECKLRGLGFEDVCYLPHILVSDEEISRGQSLVKNYKNPVAFVPNCSKGWAADREPAKKTLQSVVDRLNENHTVLQFGLSENWTTFEGVVELPDVSISDLICYYSVIKKYTGVCTGDTHLMLSVGGECGVFVPTHSERHQLYWSRWNYKSERAQYFLI